jgi:hypothetical protein
MYFCAVNIFLHCHLTYLTGLCSIRQEATCCVCLSGWFTLCEAQHVYCQQAPVNGWVFFFKSMSKSLRFSQAKISVRHHWSLSSTQHLGYLSCRRSIMTDKQEPGPIAGTHEALESEASFLELHWYHVLAVLCAPALFWLCSAEEFSLLWTSRMITKHSTHIFSFKQWTKYNWHLWVTSPSS